jgi:hypothetical protein
MIVSFALLSGCRSSPDFVNMSGFRADSPYPWRMEVHSNAALLKPRASDDAKVLVKLQHPALGTDRPLMMWVDIAPEKRWKDYTVFLTPWAPLFFAMYAWQWMHDEFCDRDYVFSGWNAGYNEYGGGHKLEYREPFCKEDGDQPWAVNMYFISRDFRDYPKYKEYLESIRHKHADGDYVLNDDGLYVSIDCNRFRRRRIWIKVEVITLRGEPLRSLLSQYRNGYVKTERMVDVEADESGGDGR